MCVVHSIIHNCALVHVFIRIVRVADPFICFLRICVPGIQDRHPCSSLDQGPGILFLIIPFQPFHSFFRVLCCGEYHVWSTSTDSNFFFHVRQNTYTVIKISAWSKEGADVPCTVCCHNHLFASKGGFQSISSTCYRRCAVVNV